MSAPERNLDSGGDAFGPLDLEFAALMERLAGAPNPEVRLAAALVSRCRSQGDVCLDLASVAGEPVTVSETETWTSPSLPEWRSRLRAASVVGRPGEVKPLILDDRDRLYLRRYWYYEDRLADAVIERAGRTDTGSAMDPTRLRELLDRLFPASGAAPDWQRVAALAAVRKRLCLISGGPGTGKTTTVVRILALLTALAAPATLRLAVTAPTGKAAARLQESLRQQKASLAGRFPEAAALPEEVQTLHRLLGSRPGSPFFRHDADHPLPIDVLVVDEASMVDLALMAKLLQAVPIHARVVLLGDKDQLASVEAGSVLGDLSADPELNRFSAGFREALAAAGGGVLEKRRDRKAPLTDAVVQLRRSHRFPEGSPIQRLSEAVNRGDAGRALVELRKTGPAPAAGVVGNPLPGRKHLQEALRTAVMAGFGTGIRAADVVGALASLNRFRILAALREGPFGVTSLNAWVEEILREEGLIAGGDPWYRGRQVLVTANDYSVDLFNGDLGVVWPDADGRPGVWFPAADGGLRRVAPGRLPGHETAFVLTVHKSQGSEFDSVLLVLPDRSSRVLTRELVYTGLTRARERTEVWYDEAVLREAIGTRTERASGLRDRLWGAGNGGR